MGSEWKTYKVEEFAEVVGGGTPRTKIDSYWNGDIPWITPKDLSDYNGRFISKGERSITKEGLNNSSAKMVPAGTVLLSSRAPVGYLAIAENPVSTNQGFRNLVVKEGFSPEFIYYLLKNNIDYLQNNASGTTFQELSGGTLKTLTFDIPDYERQCEIAQILGTLDDKIELNQRMNETLEGIARAVFKSWFVDFDPVRAKMAGEPYPLPDEVMALFPDELVESELGMIPKGWEVRKVMDLGKIITGKTPSTKVNEYYDSKDIPFIKIPDMHNKLVLDEFENYLSIKGAESQANKFLPPKSICVSCIATPGLVSMTTTLSQTNQQINSIIPKNKDHSIFILFMMERKGKEIIRKGSGGSVVSNLNKKDFSNTKLIITSNEIILFFDKMIQPIIHRMSLNQEEINNLNLIRNFKSKIYFNN